jgi:hypothetical protein
MLAAKILLDECVTVSFNKYKVVDGTFEHSVKLVGSGAKGPEVMQFAKQNGYLLVTIDQKLVTRCLRNNVPVAYYINGKAHILAVSQTFEISATTKGAPFKFKKTKPKPRPNLLDRIRNLFS